MVNATVALYLTGDKPDFLHYIVFGIAESAFRLIPVGIPNKRVITNAAATRAMPATTLSAPFIAMPAACEQKTTADHRHTGGRDA